MEGQYTTAIFALLSRLLRANSGVAHVARWHAPKTRAHAPPLAVAGQQ